MTNLEVQKALDRMVDSIDTDVLGKVMERQMAAEQGIHCEKCGHISKNLRGNSVHQRRHR